MSRESISDISFNDVSRYTRDYWDSISISVKVALLAFLDASIGLRYQWGIFSYIIDGDLLWIVQFFEYLFSSMFLLFSFLNVLKGWPRTIFILLLPFSILTIFAFCLDQLFIGLETTASTNFNLSSTFFTGLYLGAQYLSIAIGLTLIYKVQNFGNFAQAETMLIGAYVGFTLMWSPFFYEMVNGNKVLNAYVGQDEVLTWDLLFWSCLSGFFVAGLVGVIIDILVYRRFRLKNGLAQTMMIASLGISMIMRAFFYLRYGAEKYNFVPDKDWRMSTSKTVFSTDSDIQPLYGYWPEWMNQTFRFRFGERTALNTSSMDETACKEEGKIEGFSSSWNSPEEYVDSNSNGQYDKGDYFFDTNGNNQYDFGENFVDANANGQYDSGEDFVDTNGNGLYDEQGLCNIIEYLSFFESSESSFNLIYAKSALILGVFGSVILLYLMLNWTKLGRQMRAVADNPDLAASSGINVERMHAITAFLAAGMSGFAGVLFAIQVKTNPEEGFRILLPAFAVIILGSLGSVRGALIAAFIIGLVQTMSESVLIGAGNALPDRSSYSAFAKVVPFVFLIGVLMVMPKGLGHAFDEWNIKRTRQKKSWNFALPEVPKNITNLLNSVYFPDNKYVSERIKKIDDSFRGTLAILGLIQIIVVSILDIYTSGKGTAYYLIDFIYLLLEIIGFFMIYFSLAFYQTDIKLYIISTYFDLNGLSVELKRNLLSSGFLIFLLFYSIDYLVAGVGLFYLSLDFIFLLGQIFGILTILFSTFFLFDEIKTQLISYEPRRWLGELTHRINLLFVTIAFLLLKYEPLIEPSSVRDTESTLYVTEIAYVFIILSFKDLTRQFFKAIEPLQKVLSDLIRLVNLHVNIQALVFGLILVMFDKWFWGLILIFYSFNEIVRRIKAQYSHFSSYVNEQVPQITELWPKYGRSSDSGSWFMFLCFLVVLVYIVDWLPSVTAFTTAMQISRIIVVLSIFSILAISLNLHTGYTGMTNFGVIFFAGLGAVTVSILTVPEDRYGGHGWAPILGIGDDYGSAILVAILVTGVAGWLLAYPTANLRMDYFAIVTISLGEIVRIAMQSEPLLRAGSVPGAIGISQYNLPLEHWWETSMDDSAGRLLGLDQAAPYTVLLAALSLLSLFFIWIMIEMMQSSPWGRILRAIREDEEVTMHHGHNVFHHKAMSLALGASIAGFGGALWAWLNGSVLDDFFTPARTTFLIWAAFIIGGKTNNKGMIIGAFIIALTEPFFNLLGTARNDIDNAFHGNIEYIDGAFAWLIVDVFGYLSSDRSIIEVFGTLNPEGITPNLIYVKMMLIGFVILLSLIFSEAGLLPEVPKRPDNPNLETKKLPIYIWPIVVIVVLLIEIMLLRYF